MRTMVERDIPAAGRTLYITNICCACFHYICFWRDLEVLDRLRHATVKHHTAGHSALLSSLYIHCLGHTPCIFTPGSLPAMQHYLALTGCMKQSVALYHHIYIHACTCLGRLPATYAVTLLAASLPPQDSAFCFCMANHICLLP